MNRWSRSRLPARALLAFCAGGAAAPAQENRSPAGPVVELPKFVVTDNRELPPPEAWHYGTIPGFEILSNASEAATKRLVRDFEIFRLGLAQAWPIPERPGPPLALIICGSGNKFDAFAPRHSGGGPELARASLFFRQGERSAIVIDYQSKTVDIVRTDANGDITDSDPGALRVEHEKELYRCYVHSLLSRDPLTPLWFEEGLTQIIMRMKVQRDQIEFGAIDDANTVSDADAQAATLRSLDALSDPRGTRVAGAVESAAFSMAAQPSAPAEDNDFNLALRGRPLLDLAAMFAVQRDDPVALNPLGNNIWAKQCYAFVHMCLYGRAGRYKKPFAQFLVRSSREPVTEQLFKECFRFPKAGGFREMSFAQMQDELRGYIQFTDYIVQQGATKLKFPEPIALRDATEAEVGRMKGETLALAKNDDRARTELRTPYIRGERDPDLLAALGLFELAHGEAADARKFLAAATAGKTTRPEAYLEYARLLLAEGLAKPAAEGGKLSAGQARTVVDVLIGARRLQPQLPAIYETLAETWLHRAEKITTAEMTALVDGLRQFPGRLRLAYQIGALAVGANLVDLAQKMIDHGLKYAPDAATRAHFLELRAALPPQPESTAPSARPTSKSS